MTVVRSRELLSQFAEAFEKMIDPFTFEWLKKHNVGASELRIVVPHIATIVRGYLRSSIEEQRRISEVGLRGIREDE